MWRSAAAATAAGVALVFAFAPWGWWPLAVLSPAVLLLLVERTPGRRALFLGWCYGLGMFGYGVWWLQVSVHQFGVPLYVFSVGVTALFILGMALYPLLFVFLLKRLNPGTVGTIVLAPALWVLVELLRGWLFTGFPWLALGYSQTDSPLASLAPVAGVYGVSAFVMLQAALLAGLVRADSRRRLVLALGLVLTLVPPWFVRDMAFTRPLAGELEVALIQGAVPQELKWRRDIRAASIALYERLSAAHWDADIVIWPETAIAAFPHEVQDITARLERQAVETHTDLLIGMPTGEPWNGDYYNSVVDLGATPGRYDKRHLVPFGEFFPFKDWISGLAMLLDIPLSDFSAGSATQANLIVAGHRAGVSICYEDAFGREVNAALPQAAFLVNVSNDAWFGDTIAPHQHLQIARMRALETGRYLLRATNTGITAVIDEQGKVQAAAPQFSETSLRARFSARAGATPYVQYGDAPVAVIALALAGIIFLRARRPSGAMQ